LSPAERQFADQLSIQRLTLPTLHRRRRNYSKFVKFLLNSWNFAGHFGWRPQPVAYPTLSGPAERMSDSERSPESRIVFLDRRHSHEEIRELYRMAGVCMVTSLRDGMNRVAKEFVAACDDSGVPIIPGGGRSRRMSHPKNGSRSRRARMWESTGLDVLRTP